MTKFLHKYIFQGTILVLLSILLTTCSSTRFIYTFAEKYIQDEIKYFLNLNEEENILLNQQVSKMVDWHRTFMLPNYATYLNNIADKIEVGNYESDDINKLVEDGRSLIEETIIGLTPYASKFLNHQMVEDIEFMEMKMLTRRQKRIVELSKPENILYKERLERLTSNFERFFGNLNKSQLLLLESHSRVTLNESRIRLHNRTLRQKAFIMFLKTQPNEVDLTSYLNKLLLQGHLITNPSYESFSKISLKKFHVLLVNMIASSSIIQREQIISKLKSYAEDFKTVSGEESQL
jgi:hypothetical protein